MSNIKKIQIDNTDVFLEDLGDGKGKITVSNTYGYNYSYYWGSMNSSLNDFICQINKDYFSSKLLGAKSSYTIDIPATFANFRKFIRQELCIPWYKEIEFQKDLRYKLNRFQKECESANYFVDNFYSFIKDLDYSLIKDKFESRYIEKDFDSISEPWNFIIEKQNDEYIFLSNIHREIKKELSKQ